MGSAFIAGGARYKEQRFSRQGVAINLGLLIVAVIAVALPTLLSTTDDAVADASAELALSRFESAIMLLGYGLFLVFQLCTHRCGCLLCCCRCCCCWWWWWWWWWWWCVVVGVLLWLKLPAVLFVCVSL